MTPVDEQPQSPASPAYSKYDEEFVELCVSSSLIEGVDKFDQDSNSISGVAVGDWLLLDPEGHRAERRLIRKTVLHRKAAGETVKPQLIAANVDTVFIVSSCNQDFNLSRMERYLALVLESEAIPVIVLTKADLCDTPDELRQLTQSLHPGLIVETLDAHDPLQTNVLDPWCADWKDNRFTRFLGSGQINAGKRAGRAKSGHQ